MLRTLLVLTLAVSLLLVPGAARAEEDEAEARVVVIHDLHDLADRIPDLAEAIAALVPSAKIKEVQPGMLVVKARPGVQDDLALILEGLRRALGKPGAGELETAAKGALDVAREDAHTLARLRASPLDLSGEDVPIQTLVGLLARTLRVNVFISPLATKKLEDTRVSVSLHGVPGRKGLDAIARLGGVAWNLDRGIVRIVTTEEAAAIRFRLDTREVVVPDEAEWAKAAEKVTEDAAATDKAAGGDLKTLVRALHEEVRALREEVREVRSILETLRDR